METDGWSFLSDSILIILEARPKILFTGGMKVIQNVEKTCKRSNVPDPFLSVQLENLLDVLIQYYDYFDLVLLLCKQHGVKLTASSAGSCLFKEVSSVNRYILSSTEHRQKDSLEPFQIETTEIEHNQLY